MSVPVRRVRSDDDFEHLHDLLLEYEAALPQELRHGSVPPVVALKSLYDGRNAAFLAGCPDAPIGCVAVTEFDGTTAIIMRLFVKPENRGAGAARRLVSSAIDFMKEQRYERVVLDTDKDRLDAAYRLYLSFGFSECAPYGPVSYDAPTFMELYLTPIK